MIRGKRFFWTVSACALVGAIVCGWLSPWVIIKMVTPPSNVVVSCGPAVDWAIHAYRKVLFIGMFLGGVVGFILFFAFGNRRAPEEAAQPVPPSAPGDPLS